VAQETRRQREVEVMLVTGEGGREGGKGKKEGLG